MLTFLIWLALGMLALGLLGNLLGLAMALAYNLMLLGAVILVGTLFYGFSRSTPKADLNHNGREKS